MEGYAEGCRERDMSMAAQPWNTPLESPSGQEKGVTNTPSSSQHGQNTAERLGWPGHMVRPALAQILEYIVGASFDAPLPCQACV